MRKIILSMYVSLDGFHAGPNGEFDWFLWDTEMENYSINLMKTIDTMLFGRKTYQLMESYWPVATTESENETIINKMNTTSKLVVSNTLEKAEWNNSRLIKNNIVQEITELKTQSGKNIVIYGSSNLCVTLNKHKLIDEYLIFVNPVIIGAGLKLFDGTDYYLKLKLTGAKSFKSGITLLQYEPVK